MASSTPTSPPSAPPLKRLRFTFPLRQKTQDNGGKAAEFTDERELYRLLAEHEAGAYLVSNKGMWHGGIHITEAGAGRKLDLRSGIRCIADGHVIAYRLDRNYPVSQVQVSGGEPIIDSAYSTSFVLVRHVMEFPRDSRLTFYSL
ncbi:hypothetical protein [Ralstonia sp. ASV6]|uniref:hypothetical protein n=1 Tax=Ralstonia sp. ASV6 TaxID=2795124 RepID=UPI0018EC2CB0|nr:hypothetical protein [Ralstonia sp. ASV6]